MIRRSWPFLTSIILAGGFMFAVLAAALDSPHNLLNCADCHWSHGPSYPSLLGKLCTNCHYSGGPATARKGHSSLTTSATYGNWDVDCWACHDPHSQKQNTRWGTSYGKFVKDFVNARIKNIDPTAPGPYYYPYVTVDYPTGIMRTVTNTNPLLFTSQTQFINGSDGMPDNDICQVCHANTSYYNRASHVDFHSAQGSDSQPGGNCTACHMHSDGFAAKSCTGCHSSPQGPRRAIVGEFSSTSHHVSGGAVTDDDCKVCHYEAVSSAAHKNGVIDLRDPDTGNPITGFTQFSRNTTTNVLESWVIDVQNNFCLKCHDSDASRGAGLGGAPGTMFSTNPLQPFSWPSRNVPDVYGQFNTANPFHHAVRGAGTNPYTTSTTTNGNKITMEPPWNQTAGSHNVVSCFDCHGVPDGSGIVRAIGHGSTNQRMLRTPIDLNTMESVTVKTALPAGMGLTVETFCLKCHKASVYKTASNPTTAGSIFEYHGAAQNQHAAGNPSGGNELGCMGCHGGIKDFGELNVSNGAARGRLHGGSFTWPSQSFANGTSTQHFMLGGWISGWQTVGSTGYCRGGACNHKNSSKNYTR